MLPLALEQGDLDLLYTLLQDKVHVPYRQSLIHDYKAFEELAIKEHIPFTISGSGSTMLYIVKDENSLLNQLKELKTTYEFKVAVVSIDEDGATITKENDYE
jgi:homoserine kinase